MRFWPPGLAQKIAVLVLVALVVTGAANWFTNEILLMRAMRREVEDANRGVAEALAGRLDAVIAGGIQDLLTIARYDADRLLAGIPSEQRFSAVHLRARTFDDVELIDTDGRVLAGVMDVPPVTGGDFNPYADILRAVATRPYYVSNAVRLGNGGYGIVVAVPVRESRSGRVGRALIGEIYLDTNPAMTWIFSNRSDDRSRVAAVVDGDGRIVYHPDRAVIGSTASMGEVVARVTAGDSGAAEAVDEQGRRFLVGYYPLRAVSWGVIVTTPADEAVAPLKAAQRRVAGVGLVTLVIAGFIAWAAVRRLMSPLDRMLQAIQAVSQGNMNIRFPTESLDEWGVLARAFNQMVCDLGSHHRELEERAQTDPLTGLANRDLLGERLERQLNLSRRLGTLVSVLMIDIDDFKSYNDSFGHLAGDGVLTTCAAIFREMVRDGDTVSRYGGEEFLVILPNADTEVARFVAERIRMAVEYHHFPYRPVTISIGIASFPEHAADADQLVERADAALYAAKREGKNRTKVWGGK